MILKEAKVHNYGSTTKTWGYGITFTPLGVLSTSLKLTTNYDGRWQLGVHTQLLVSCSAENKWYKLLKRLRPIASQLLSLATATIQGCFTSDSAAAISARFTYWKYASIHCLQM